jgi:amino acid adenylation domain-containing protein
VHELFSARVAENPGALAVSAPDAVFTYGELERRANQLAHRLRALGAGDDSRVALCLPRSAAMVVAALGILKAGGAYVALDPSHPADRLRFMIDDCGAELVVTCEPTSHLDTSRASVVAVDQRANELELEPIAPPENAKRDRDLAYVIYTSGSTGSPKGVLVHHGGLANLVSWHQETFAVTATDRATQIASPAFDAVVWELWPYLTIGASVHIPAEGVRADPVAIRDWLVAERITLTFLPTALAEMVMTLEWPRETSLRYLLTGGDTLYRHPPSGLPFAVVNNYGPTEGTVVATSGVVPAGQSTVRAPSIGCPIRNVRAHVVDERLDEVTVGTKGELLIGGPGVALGYLGQPTLTAEKFIRDRFSDIPDARLYRTGDYVRQRPDGELEFCGRIDEQVQIRGYRVELGEISATLRRHLAVRSSVVLVDQQGSSEPRLIAYVVCDEPRPDSQQLQTHLAGQLPSYMVPTAFVHLDEMPLMANGKLDRACLPTPILERASEWATPESGLEQVLETIVAELLGLSRVRVDENFFMLGGHSLLGAQLIARIGSRFGVEMSLRSLFDNPTVAEMATEVERLLIAEVAAMSDADAARLLAADSGTTSASADGGSSPRA